LTKELEKGPFELEETGDNVFWKLQILPLIEPCNSVVLKEKVLGQLSLRKCMIPCFGILVDFYRMLT